MVSLSTTWLAIIILIMIITFTLCTPITFIITQRILRRKMKSMDSRVTNLTPVSLLEVKVTLPSKMIFEAIPKMFDPSELAQIPKTRIGEGTLGTLYKVVLNCGSVVTLRKIREGLVMNSGDFEKLIKFFGGMKGDWVSALQSSFWYGGEAFVVHEYFCLGSLEQLLHGCEGIQFTPLSCEIRLHIALCAAKGVAFIHKQVTRKGAPLFCGVIKSSNILIQIDFSAFLSGCEMPYLISPTTIIRRNPGRVAPELANTQNTHKVFTHKSDVYSFGVLLLEIVTGKKPMVTELREYVKEKRKREGLKGVYDKKMVDVKENVADLLIGIAELCLKHNPKERPDMDGVVEMIQGL